MTPSKQTLQEFMTKSFERFRVLPSQDIDAACDRVLDRLRLEQDRSPEPVVVKYRSPRYARLIVVFAALTAAAIFAQQLATRSTTTAPPPEQQAPVQSVATETIAEIQQPVPEPPKKVAPSRPRFAAESIKVMPPATMMTSAGLACRGVDGVKRVVIIVTPDAQREVSAPQGRCVGRGIFLSTLIEVAYRVQPQQITGGDAWTRTSGSILSARGGMFVGLPAQWDGNLVGWFEKSFQIEAVADDPGTATLGQLQQMLQSMIEDRFKLKFHLDRKEVPGYSLVIAEGGHKLKPISGDYEESLVAHDGRSTVEKLARSLASFLLDEVPVVDKTGLKGAYEYKFDMLPAPAARVALNPPPSNGGGERRGGGAPSVGNRAEGLSKRLEEQLGLRLQAEKAVPVDVLVIDSVEPPSAN
jgi:uncharacterized protein (TIGR03435 family)